MRRMLRREEGLAMITAIMVTMVVLTLSVVMVQLSIHNSDSSAVNRGRVAAVNAAEGGINLVFSQVERNGYANLPCTLDGDLTTTPVEHYHVVVDYYPSYPPSGAKLTCPLGQNPAGAVITSTGTSPGANAAHPVTRIMQAEARLRLVTGNASFLGTMYGQSGVSMSNTTTLTGYQGNDANVYTGGAWSCGNSATIQGSVYAASVTSSGPACTVNQDVWATGSVSGTGTIIVGHDLTSSTSSVSINGSSHVTHNATTGTTCSGCTGRVDGTITTNHTSPAPPLPTYPTLNYTASDWQGEGYTIRTFSDCAAAQTFLLDPGDSTKYVVRITPTCNLSISNQATMKVYNNIAIISDGDINVTNKFAMTSVDGQKHTVYWIVPTSSNPTCGSGRINFNNEVSSTDVRVFVYSPCAVTWTNKTALEGQIFGKTVSVTNSFGLGYYPISVPGYSSTPGYNVDIAFIREIAQ